MDHVCMVFPILPGKTEAARAFHQELDTIRKPEYDRSERRIGVSREYWFIAPTPNGDQLVVFLDTRDVNQAFSDFIQSRDEFDLWFKQCLADVTGVDLNNPPAEMRLPELVSTYEA